MMNELLCCSVLLWTKALFAQGPNSYQITPNKATMLIGQWRPFCMVDQDGHAQHKVTWTVSDEDAFQTVEGDDLQLGAKRAGEFRVTARTDFAVAEATVKVMEGSTLPAGTVQWSSGKIAGCKTVKIIQAAPRANGPAMFVQSQCEDGQYAAAYTAAGVQLWRRKISDSGAPDGQDGNDYDVVGQRLDPRSISICDSASVGMEQQKIHDLLTERKLPYREEPAGGRVWLVEESNSQCRLWFDEKSVLVKKRKVFTGE